MSTKFVYDKMITVVQWGTVRFKFINKYCRSPVLVLPHHALQLPQPKYMGAKHHTLMRQAVQEVYERDL